MKLEDLHKKNKPEVPEGYFEKMTAEVLEKTQEIPRKKKGKVIHFSYYLAAGFALLIGISVVNYFFETPPVNENGSHATSTNEVTSFNEYYEYVDLYISEYEAEDLLLNEHSAYSNESREDHLMMENDVEQIIELL